MMCCYPPTGYVMFSLKKLTFYGDRGPDNPNTLEEYLRTTASVERKNVA